MIEVEEAFRLALPHHVLRVRVGAADFGFLDRRLAVFGFEGLLRVS